MNNYHLHERSLRQQKHPAQDVRYLEQYRTSLRLQRRLIKPVTLMDRVRVWVQQVIQDIS